MNLRVLHLIPTLGAGGAERQLSLLAPEMVSLGVECHIAYMHRGPNLLRLENSGVHLHQLPFRGNHDLRIVSDILTLMRCVRPNLVQTWLLQMDVMGGVAARWANVPQVLSERSSVQAYPTNWKFRLRSFFGRRTAAIVANSLGGADYWRAQGYEGPLRVIRNGIAPPALAQPIDDFGLAGVPLLMFAGRLSYEKNLPVLIDALAGALQQLPSHHAVLFGEGPLKDEVERHIGGCGVGERFHLGGFSAELGYWLQHADAFVSVSSFEGHPNVVIEAAASGCPLVLSDIPAHREVVDGSAALFASPNDVAGLVNNLVNTVLDRTAALERARRAKVATAELSVAKAASQYTALYRELCHEKN